MEKKYLTVVETAKLIRASLKAAFPGQKFSVVSDSYAGGASIRIHYQDGPTGEQVKFVVGAYQAGGFDGTIDMAYSAYSWLWFKKGVPFVEFAKSQGTQGSMGSCAAYDYAAPVPEAELVHFGADHVFVERKLTPEFKAKAAAKFEALEGEARAKALVALPYRPQWDETPRGELYAYQVSAQELGA